MHLVPVRIQLNSTYEDCCCCCIYEHLRGPLLLLVLVHQLVYHAVLLLCLIYHTQLISLYDHNMLEAFRFFFHSDLH